MPTTINDLLKSIRLDPKKLKTVKWQQPLDSSSMGIYIVSTSESPNKNNTIFDKAPIDDKALALWLDRVESLEVDNKKPSIAILKDRLSSFWLRDENIIYIGQTESNKGLKGRVAQFYNTDLGERKPHAGGHWIKTLLILENLYVHYLPDNQPTITEEKLLIEFGRQISQDSKSGLFDQSILLPFANLELEKGNRKKHGISNSKLRD